ncbi:winged helix-turn-helix domain-containing protein [Enterococcus avium]|uniref:winged helix-turn-helix domain-containing protein n=1 Tax=Enterococcus avium TaxID=33945 RepID=UPI0026F87A7F|nr:helix-turn-helix domain-containing protein [Enterococcus avium]MDO7798987.1 helix-turn-helix domain-containing protein [Enterococcus avium]
MGQVLLLTKNIYNEHLFEGKIRQLGHEILISTNLIEKFLLGKVTSEFIEMFNFVILSETIENREVELLSEVLLKYSINVLRISDDLLDDTRHEDSGENAIKDWIEPNPKIDVLREKLSCKREIKIRESQSLSSLKLSYGERKLFTILYKQQDKILSRDDLCLHMWNKENTNSAMSQLSVLVKSLKDKLSQQNITGPIIETCWGKGYKIDRSVYDQIYIDI